MEPVKLFDAQFRMQFGPGSKGDTWMLYGQVWGHPRFPDGDSVHISTPVSYDKETKLLSTVSGRTYRLIEPSAKVEQEIVEVIERGGYSTH